MQTDLAVKHDTRKKQKTKEKQADIKTDGEKATKKPHTTFVWFPQTLHMWALVLIVHALPLARTRHLI